LIGLNPIPGRARATRASAIMRSEFKILGDYPDGK
jgi:hypothetical protein